FEQYKRRVGARQDTDLDAATLKEIAGEFKKIVERETGQPYPTDPIEQLRLAIGAVFDSWMGKRAVDYRDYYKIPHDLGTAVNVQTMVFGNMGDDSGTGVAFTRNPSTGEPELYGEFLPNAQGEDVVAGIRTPLPISRMQEVWPQVYQQFSEIAHRLERHYRDTQDMEFTVERSRLYMLQTRTAKRTARAAVKIATDMVREGLISRQEAVMRIEPDQVVQLLLPRFDEAAREQAQKQGRLLAKGLPASPGAAVGTVVFDPDRAEALGKQGQKVILVRPETSPDDVHGMIQAQGVVTSHGGMTSHAAVVARGMGKPAIVGAESIAIDLRGHRFSADGRVVQEGEWISVDGTTGEVLLGQLPAIPPEFEREVELVQVLTWADEFRRLGVWANADYPRDAQRARAFGAQGIGLCRTEHMFMEADRLPWVQQMILAAPQASRSETARARYLEALQHLLGFQRDDFKGILQAMAGLPVIIRLIDPPLHEFLPRHEQLLVEVTELRTRGKAGPELEEKEALLSTVEQLREANPMLGLRGCRLGILFPEITQMQVRAILEAAVALARQNVETHPEIMIPLVGDIRELRAVRENLEQVARAVEQESGTHVNYKFGTMIELPRAALTADKIAEDAEFFSFGTNDLTQTTYGFSRDDAEAKFLGYYLEHKILPFNPFQTLDREGVGKLVQTGVQLGRTTRPELEIGICGEHGGDPNSIEFCHLVGLNYVSMSPFRVPVARLAAAQAALTHGGGAKEVSSTL
ncbi:MAG: pyruvate, phosphate dikinase, partial [Chloroflexi bacterium]|nr:pyruvate, phosphate dikinase [Chloroflexota bacterium]